MTVVAVYHFADNNGKRAETRLHLGGDFISDASIGLALMLASALQGASDARLVRVELAASFNRPGAAGPQLGSDVRRTGILFYRNGDDCSSFSLPSLNRLYAESSGRYAGVRVTRSSLDLWNMLNTMDTLLVGALDPVGRPYGSRFSVGCIQDASE